MFNDNWTDDELEDLGQTIIRTISAGGTVNDGCMKYEEAHPNRSLKANSYQWNTKIKKKFDAAYREAKAIRASLPKPQKMEQQRLDEKSQLIVKSIVDTSSVTQKDLLRLLKNVKVVPDDAEEIDSLKSQLVEVQRERDTIRMQLVEMQAKYTELRNEFEVVMTALQVARKHMTNTNSVVEHVVVGKGGVVESVITK